MTAQIKNALAMTAFGTISIFVRGIALSSMEIAFWRGSIALVVLWFIKKAFYRENKVHISRKQKVLLFLSGMAVGLNWALLFMAYEHTSIAVATLAYYFAPVIVMIVSPLLFKERMTLFQLLCFVMATAGLVLVVSAGNSMSGGSRAGIGFGLGAAVFYAAVVLMNKWIREGSGLERTIIQFFGAVALLFVILMVQGGFRIQTASPGSIGNLLIVGVIYTGLCYWLYFSSIKDLAGQQTAILSYLDPFVAILVSTLFFREPIRVLQGIGAVLILGFTCAYQLDRGQRDAADKE